LRQSTSIGSKSSCSVPARIFEYEWAREGVEPLGQGRALLRQISRLGLGRIGAEGQLDVVQPGTPLGEFYRLSLAATAKALVAAGGLTADEVAQLVARFDQPDFLVCGFVYIGAWGRRSRDPAPRTDRDGGRLDYGPCAYERSLPLSHAFPRIRLLSFWMAPPSGPPGRQILAPFSPPC